jgi:moderate conductance mechanosensitive channel
MIDRARPGAGPDGASTRRPFGEASLDRILAEPIVPQLVRRAIRLSLFVLHLIFATAPAFATPSTSADNASSAGTTPAQAGAAIAGMTPVETQQLIDTLNDPDRRAALVSALKNLQRIIPLAAPAATKPGAADPAAATPRDALKPDSVGAQLAAGSTWLADMVSASLVLAVRGIADIPNLLSRLSGIIQDPATLLEGAILAGRLLCVMLLGFGGEFLVWRLTCRFYESLAVDVYHEDREVRGKEAADDEAGAVLREPDSPAAARAAHRARLSDGLRRLRRLPFILMAMTVDLLPPLAFLAAATLLLRTPLVASDAVRTVILAVVDAYVIVSVSSAVARATVGAPSGRLRLLPVSDDVARYLMVWVRRIAVVIVFGYAVSELGLFFGMDGETRQGMLRLISLLVHIMLVVMVLQCRIAVSARLSGSGRGFLGTLRRRLAGAWHVYAIIFIAAGWIVYATQMRDGFERLIQFMLSTIVVGLAARVTDIALVGALDRALSVAHNGSPRLARIDERIARYHQPLRSLLRLLINTAAIMTLLQLCGLDVLGWFTGGALGSRLASFATTLIVTLCVAVALWEAINVAMQIYLDELSQRGAVVRAARLRTIVPLLRNTLLMALTGLIVLTTLSEIGVNIGPLLAGASIFGVALGFGSQKLVQDFITGIFLLVENAMQVGDTVTAGGLSGTVEHLSIRTLRLRAGDGSIHLIPFSSVSTVTNSNRGFGNAAVAVTVDYDEDTDHVGAVLAKIVREMRDDKRFTTGMLSDLQLWGVDRVDGTTVTLAGQIVCTDGARWDVQREFNRRVKMVFQEKGIRMMPAVIGMTGFPHPLDVRMERAPATRHDAVIT